jgi:hypothetical protein
VISKGKTKTAIEKQWLADVVDYATESGWLTNMYAKYCDNPTKFQIDHILGAQAKRKVNGVTTKVGEFAIMAIPMELHDITSNHPLNRTLKPRAYRDRFGHELSVWNKMLAEMENEGYELPFSKDLIDAVVMR